MIYEAATAPTLMRLATERSIEPHRITKVCPTPTIPSATMRCNRPTQPTVCSWLVCPVHTATPT